MFTHMDLNPGICKWRICRMKLHKRRVDLISAVWADDLRTRSSYMQSKLKHEICVWQSFPSHWRHEETWGNNMLLSAGSLSWIWSAPPWGLFSISSSPDSFCCLAVLFVRGVQLQVTNSAAPISLLMVSTHKLEERLMRCVQLLTHTCTT